MSTIAERVEAGAKWLDANRPGWVDRINLNTLDLGYCTQCVLGQLDGDYCHTIERDFGDKTAEGVRNGFALAEQNGKPAPDEAFAELTAAWRDYITARRAA